ncbi:MAG: glycosyltransferase [Oenococcus oeni]
MTNCVLIATYNGEEFIKQELVSIYKQSVKPDMVIIQDDRSSDQTTEIVEQFISSHKLQNWYLRINERNIGWRENFISLIKSAKADNIFLADQDDIWYKDKIKFMSDLSEHFPKIGLLVSDYDFFGSQDSVRNISNIKSVKIAHSLYRATYNVENVHVGRDGCSFMLKKDLVPNVLDVFEKVNIDAYGKKQSHDQAIWLAGLFENRLYWTNSKTMNHRYFSESSWSKENIEVNRELLHKNLSLINYYDCILRYVAQSSKYDISNFQYLEDRVNDLKIENQVYAFKAQGTIKIFSIFCKKIKYYSSYFNALKSIRRILR